MSKKLKGILPVIFILFFLPFGLALFPGLPIQELPQPIPFSHRLHCTELKLDCLFCHTTADRSDHASLPDSALCLRCHQFIASDSPHIQNLRRSFELGDALHWIRITDLPDFVRFSHRAHAAFFQEVDSTSNGFGCRDCHGRVEEMEQTGTTETFTMGWCVNCHRRKVNELRSQGRAPPYQSAGRLTECDICHY